MGLFDTPEERAAKQAYKEEMRSLAEAMKPTGKIIMTAKWDDELKVISIGTFGGTIIKYDTIKSVEVHEEVKEITTTKSKGKEKRKGVITRAVVGTMLMPGVGTLAGAMTAKKQKTGEATQVTNQEVTRTLVVTREDPYNTVLNFPYNAELEVKLREILESNQVKSTATIEQPSVENSSSLDDIVKLKELLDAGILTEEEFSAKKKQILGI